MPQYGTNILETHCLLLKPEEKQQVHSQQWYPSSTLHNIASQKTTV